MSVVNIDLNLQEIFYMKYIADKLTAIYSYHQHIYMKLVSFRRMQIEFKLRAICARMFIRL